MGFEELQGFGVRGSGFGVWGLGGWGLGLSSWKRWNLEEIEAFVIGSKPETKPETRDSRPETRDPRPETLNLEEIEAGVVGPKR
jgi:hypothetical protein